MENFLPWISLLIGLAARVFLPWLAIRRADPEKAKWDWIYFWPQLLGFVLILMVLPLVISDLSMVSNLPPQAAWLLGWGAADLGRQTYKAFSDQG